MPLLSLTDARTTISRLVTALDPVPAPLPSARGRILRAPVLAPEDMPAFDRSAMDGYALAADDPAERFRVVAEIQAGADVGLVLGRGECARIFTGAPIPAGATQVIIQEETVREGDWMMPKQRDGRTWIRKRGEDARRGDLLLEAGTRLGAGELGLLAQVGIVEPLVSPVVRVLHLTTGDELVDPGQTPGPGQIRDSNSTLIRALLAQAGAELVEQGRCGDTLEDLADSIAKRSPGSWDVLLISGGASVGDYDFGVRALEKLGFEIHFRQLNLRPGKPLVFATRGRQVAFVIPGNPVSHFVTFHVAISLTLECLAGAPARWTLLETELAGDVGGKADARETWWPASVNAADGRLCATPRVWQSSGDSRGLVEVNGLLRIPAGAAGGKAGDRAECLLLGF